MTYKEALDLKNKIGTTIIKKVDNIELDMEVIIVPKKPTECADYLEAYRGESFNDLNASLHSSNQEYEVLGIHCIVTRSKYVTSYLS